MEDQAVDVSNMLTTDDAAKRLGVTRSTIQKYIEYGHLRSYKIKGRRYISEEMYAEFLVKKKAGEPMPITKREYGVGNEQINHGNDLDPYLALAAAVVKGVLKEYKSALKRKNWGQITAIEKWLCSKDAGILSMDAFNPKQVIAKARKMYLS